MKLNFHYFHEALKIIKKFQKIYLHLALNNLDLMLTKFDYLLFSYYSKNIYESIF